MPPMPNALLRRIVALALAGGLVTPAAAQDAPRVGAPTVGAPLPPWTPGMLDIHQISTGRGNSALLVLPDGTTLLVDAGAARDGIPETDPHPDASRSPGDWIARYVRRHLPPGATGIDYALLTHFHPDHYGQPTPRAPLDASGAYRLAGITEVGTALRIGTLVDRGWPDYLSCAPLGDSTHANYRRFVDAQRARGMRVERFRVGARDQLRLRHDAARHASFEIRNVVGNGELWTGVGDATRKLFPPTESLAPEDRPNENMCSLGVRLTYGAFRWFTGGDLPGTPDPGFPAWHGLESAVAPVVGRVDVHVVDHHGSVGEESEPFLRALASSVLVIPSWSPSHVAPDVLKRIVNSRLAPRERLILATDLRPSARTVIGPRASAIAAPPGHVVVRVAPGGARYWVIATSSADERDVVVAVWEREGLGGRSGVGDRRSGIGAVRRRALRAADSVAR